MPEAARARNWDDTEPEARDVDARWLFIFAACFVAGLAVVLAALWLVFGSRLHSAVAAKPLSFEQRSGIAGPEKLLEQIVADEEAALRTLAVRPGQPCLATIPVEDAMRLIVERGLPDFAAAPQGCDVEEGRP